jgi:adenylylsulfate kinase
LLPGIFPAAFFFCIFKKILPLFFIKQKRPAMSENIFVVPPAVTREEKEVFLKQRSKVVWFTGLSGSGKTTIARALAQKLFQNGYFAQTLDGDNIRSGINSNVDFSEEGRYENIRRIAEVSKLMMNAGIITINSFITPIPDLRNMAKEIIGEDDFMEVFIHAPIEVCEERDVKGLYKKARKGLIKDFTGIDAPFIEPENADIVVHTHQATIEDCVENLYKFLEPWIKYRD